MLCYINIKLELKVCMMFCRKGFEVAFDLLSGKTRTGCQSTIVFVTDGQDTDGEQVRCGPGLLCIIKQYLFWNMNYYYSTCFTIWFSISISMFLVYSQAYIWKIFWWNFIYMRKCRENYWFLLGLIFYISWCFVNYTL